MDKGLRILKLVLLGIAVIAIPIIFILQEEKINKDEDEKQKKEVSISELNCKIIQLEGLIQSKDDLLKYFSLSQQNTWTQKPKLQSSPSNLYVKEYNVFEIIFSKDIDKLIVQSGTLKNGSTVTYLYDTLPISNSDATFLKNICKYYIYKKYKDSQLDK